MSKTYVWPNEYFKQLSMLKDHPHGFQRIHEAKFDLGESDIRYDLFSVVIQLFTNILKESPRVNNEAIILATKINAMSSMMSVDSDALKFAQVPSRWLYYDYMVSMIQGQFLTIAYPEYKSVWVNEHRQEMFSANQYDESNSKLIPDLVTLEQLIAGDYSYQMLINTNLDTLFTSTNIYARIPLSIIPSLAHAK